MSFLAQIQKYDMPPTVSAASPAISTAAAALSPALTSVSAAMLSPVPMSNVSMPSPVSQPIVTHVQQQQPVMAASPLVMPSPRMPATSIQVIHVIALLLVYSQQIRIHVTQ